MLGCAVCFVSADTSGVHAVRNLSLSINATLQALCPPPPAPSALCIRFSILYPPFETETDLIAYIQSERYNQPPDEGGLLPIASAVVFNKFGVARGVPSDAPGFDPINAPNRWDYSLRVNRSAIANINLATE